MKILMATNYFASHRGGIEIVAGELFRGLTDSGQEVIWIAADCTPPPERIGSSRAVGLRVFNFAEKFLGLPLPIPTIGGLSRIRRLMRDCEIVIVHDCLYITNIATFLIARITKRPVILVQHIGSVPYQNPFLCTLMKLANRTVTHWMLSRAQQVVFISEAIRDFFGGLPFRNPPEVIFNGVDGNLYNCCRAAGEKAALRGKYGLPESGPVALFVGRFVEKKGLAILELLASQRKDITWVFAGWGPLDPRQWTAANVRVFSGLEGLSLAGLYRASDVLVLPSVGEGFPLVVQEALASGLPVVCSDTTAAADPAMLPYIHGIPIYPGDDIRTAREFLEAIETVIAGGAKDEKGREERSGFAVSRYSWRYAVKRYIEIGSRRFVKKAAANGVPEPAAQKWL